MSDSLKRLAAIRENTGRVFNTYLDLVIESYGYTQKIVLIKKDDGSWEGIPQEMELPPMVKELLAELKKRHHKAIADYENEKRRQYELFTHSQLSVPWNQ